MDPDSCRRSFANNYCSLAESNLQVLTEATVKDIIVQERDGHYVATGVRYQCQGKDYVASVSREVVVSAGTIKSPQILELSGIGNPEVLTQANIPVKVVSPRVGENLQDHLSQYLSR